MHFFSFFKTLVGKKVVVELKNGVALSGVLHSLDQFLNVKLVEMEVEDPEKHPHLVALTNVFLRGSVIRYIRLPSADVDTQLLEDATRRAVRGAE